MTKILNNAIIAKCGECPNKVTSMSHNSVSCSVKPRDAMFCSFVNPDSIDQSCPLQTVGVFSNNAGLEYVLNLNNFSGEYLNSVDYIVIVKRGDR